METVMPLQIAYSNQKHSILFGKFPAEIRNRIYEVLLLTDQLADDRSQDPTPYFWVLKVIEGAIVRTCRAVLFETYPVLYGRNTFFFSEAFQIEKFQSCHLPLWHKRGKSVLFQKFLPLS